MRDYMSIGTHLPLNLALEIADNVGKEYARTVPEGHWYPCGFAWIAYKCRKNAKEARILLANGFHWNDYSKHYYKSAPTNTQSMNYQEAVLQAMQKSLVDNGYTNFHIQTRID